MCIKLGSKEPGKSRQGQSDDRKALLVAELMAYRGQLDQASKIMVEHGAAQAAIDMYTEVHTYITLITCPALKVGASFSS